VEGLARGKVVVRISKEQVQSFDPIAYMRERVETRYRVFKEWLERNRI
jgi:hypothetical protein